MKFNKRVISLLLVAIMIFNSIPAGFASAGELTINGSLTDAIEDMEYGWNGKTYRFADDVLKGVQDGDEVYLVADVVTSGTITVGSKVSLKLSNFRLEGADAADYLLPDLTDYYPVEKEITILPKTIVIQPAQTSIYYGQDLPEDGILTELADYSDQLVSNGKEKEEVEISCTFKVDFGGYEEGGTYAIEQDGEVSVEGRDAKNYAVEVAKDLTFRINAYETEAQAKNGTDGGLETATLYAPKGFLISATGGLDDKEWSSRIIVALEETQSGSIPYYLRNNDAKDAEHYRAICRKVYNYSAMPLPEVTGIRVEKADDTGNILTDRTDGVFANCDVKVTVYVTGGRIARDTTIYLILNGEEQQPEPVTVKAADAVKENGKYTYQASFTVASDEGKTLSYTLDAYAEDSVGESESYKGKYMDCSADVTMPLVLDREGPVAAITLMNGNYEESILAQFTAADTGSGVATVEYSWDQNEEGSYDLFGQQNDGDKKKTQESMVEVEDDTVYQLILPWENAGKVDKGKHTLYLRVTDALGNMTLINKQDEAGSDTLPPVIDSVKITTGNGAVIEYLSEGNFAGEEVHIAITARDNAGDGDVAVSGIREVSVKYNESGKKNTTVAKWDDKANAYVMPVEPDRKLTDIRIIATDNCGNSTPVALADISADDEFASNDLYVEDDAPSISSNLIIEDPEGIGHLDSKGNVWIGIDATEKDLIIYFTDGTDNFTDGTDNISSGVASVTIVDGEEELYAWSGNAGETAPEGYAHQVSEFVDGDHTIEVKVVDKCGNSSTKSISFTKDTEKPENSAIKVLMGEKVLETPYWFDEDDANDGFAICVGSTDETLLAQIELVISDAAKPDEKNMYKFDYEQILEGSDDYSVWLSKEWITKRIALSEGSHTYIVSAKVYDLAWNSYDLGSVEIHVDKEAPTIERITVQKSDETAVEKVLRLLTFGIFANDDLTFRVHASEPEHDSGLAKATIQGFAEDAPQDMNWDEENDCYWFEVPAKSKALVEGNLVFAVYDKYGKCTEARPILTEPVEGVDATNPPIEDAEGEQKPTNSYYVMIETNVPWLSFELPDGDSFDREDDQIWYNENKNLTLTVHDLESGIYSVSVKVNGKPVTIDNELVAEAEECLTSAITYNFDIYSLIEDAGKAKDGQYCIEIVVTDNAGNETPLTETFFLDETPPRIDRITFDPETVDRIAETTTGAAELVEGLEYGFFFNQQFTATVHVSDDEDPSSNVVPSSGLYVVKYRLVPYVDGVAQEATTHELPIVDGMVEIQAPEGFVGQLFVEALDYVGNSSGEQTTKAYVTDSAAPNISITKNQQTTFKDAEGNPLYTQTNSFTVVISDYPAGLERISYSKDAEQFPQTQQTLDIRDGAKVGDILGDGWEVVSVNGNLVTQIRKTFEFAADDNNVVMHFDAVDHAHNEAETVSSEVFTVDTIAPVIRVVFREDNDDDLYYDQNRVADIYVTERNFDAALINVLIQNTFGAVPGYTFSSTSLTEHTATIDFGEGDYTFDVNGSDLSGRNAEVSFSGGNEKLFYVDKTVPVIVENFAEFANNSENSFNVDKTATITITEHNFNSDLTNLRITRKATGEEHSQSGMVDVTAEILSGIRWTKNGDTYSISFTFDKDAVYYVQISPVDLASNQGDTRSTVVFEIDKTVPVVSAKNGNQTGPEDTEFLDDIYTYERKDAPVPTVSFTDKNISHIEYTLTTYIPEYLSDGLVAIKPKTIQGRVDGDLFTLADFAEDGIYALELVAVDVAGNRSVRNINTYARMVYQDVLAFILDSSSAEGTGLYSLEHENGEAISKKPSDFMDLRIMVFASTGTNTEIVLRDTDGENIPIEAYFTIDNSVYGIDVKTFEIDADFFRDKFQEDDDREMNLTVRNEDYRIDLAKIHIDSIAPTCDLPEELTSWRWFAGEADRTFTITNISELLEEADCKVYDNGELIPFDYSAEEDTITFTLSKGWHNVGIILCDAAGNSNITQEIMCIHIGYFWIILVSSLFAMAVAAIVVAFFYKRKREKQEMIEKA